MAPTISFGIELEFLIEVEHQRDSTTVGPLSKTIPIPPELSIYSSRARQEAAHHVGRTVSETISRNVVVCNVFDQSKAEDFTMWTVAQDYSVMPPSGIRGHWISVELISPAFLSNDVSSFSQIVKVVKSLATSYNIHLNPSCGFHVHCGLGLRKEDRMPLWLLKRLGMLFWAVDPVLSRLHPPERLINPSLAGIRLDSRLASAAGMPSTQKVLDEISEDIYMQPEAHDWKAGQDQEYGLRYLARQGAYTPAGIQQRQSLAAQEDRREHLEKAWRLPWADNAALRRHSSVHGDYPIPQRAPSIRNASAPPLRELLYCSCKPHVGALLSSPGMWRPNYSFGNYRLDRSRQPESRKPTIEFRQAGGTMDARWIVIWTKICIALMEYARNSTMEELMELLNKLEQREVGDYGTSCSVAELLRAIGKGGLADAVKQRFEDVGRKGWYY
ncbi:hypothetical protein J7T55_015480 [Diaporthe amygdali]|uniref:uncharacterized protein n=1 Tax=Phomopsis amygdali TaxID=1214568 RepID=UPI0022FE1F27|nr:uncharacterized protein J7T55_015480 [Diaporthe amygdali]KAJ0120748.1 hypothetical protein J7T55_015480 [Diaporthe amygdali]